MTTYYVDGAVGSDSNAGTSEGSGNAWLTIDKAMNTVAAGDKVFVKATGTYSETPNIDTAGGATTPIVFEGYTTTTGDMGKVTIGGTTNCLTSSLSAAIYYVIKNFKFNGASSDGVFMANSDNVAFYNCEFNSNGAAGIDIDNSCSFYNCEANNNSQIGFEPDSSATFIGCISHGNGLSNINATSGLLVYRCLSYSPGSSWDCIDIPIVGVAIGNTVDGENSSDGWIISSDATPIFIDNIVYDCATGVSMSAVQDYATFVGHNLMNSNTTDYSVSGEMVGLQDVTAAPAFTDEANDDYTLGDSSPAKAAGLTPGGIT